MMFIERSALQCAMAIGATLGILLSTVLTPEAVAAPAKGRLTFSDEFSSYTLNRSKWNTTYWWGGRTNTANNEAQIYLDNAFLMGLGVMRIKANNKPSGGAQYTSGMITSCDKFSQQYGYFEMRAMLPKGKGLWPAFWLLPAAKKWPPEIDIMEFLGHDPMTAYMTNHYGEWPNNKMVQGMKTGTDFNTGFHKFGLEWRKEVMIWYVDDIEVYRTTEGVPQERMYILANLAVGGNWPGYPDATTKFPAYMAIDYIRAYALP